MAVLLSIAFPFAQSSTSYPASATDDEAIQASIIQIIMTPVGSRICRPLFGSRVLEYVFESDSAATREGLEMEIRTAISTWEPRVRVSSVVVEANQTIEPGEILATVNYVIIANNKRSSVTVGL